MPPVRPDFVFLDLGQVIVTFDRERSFRQMAEVSGADPAAIRRVVLDEGLQTELERGGIGWEGFHAEFSRRTGTAPDPRALAHAASDMFALKIDMLPAYRVLMYARKLLQGQDAMFGRVGADGDVQHVSAIGERK